MKAELLNAQADIYCLQEVNIGGSKIGQHISLNAFLKKATNREYESFATVGANPYFAILPQFITQLAPISFIIGIFLDFCALFNEYYLSKILGKHIQDVYNNAILRIAAFIVLGTAWCFGNASIFDTKKFSSSLNKNQPEVLLIGGFRCVQVFTLEIEGKTIIMVNVHLSAEPSEELTRVKEATTICNYIDSLCQERNIGGILVVGDFNSLPDGPCYSEFLRRGR